MFDTYQAQSFGASKNDLLKYAKKHRGQFGNNLLDFNKAITHYAERKGIKANEEEICRIVRKAITDDSVVPSALTVMTAKQLSESNLPPLEFCIEGLLSHGVSILTAKPKFYKSWMSMQMCISVSNGLPFMGFKTNKSAVLYCDLENDLRITKERLSLMLGDAEPPDSFYIVNEIPTMEQGLVPSLEEFLPDHPDVKLIVIDLFEKVKYHRKSNEQDYDADYRSISELKDFSKRNDLAVLLIAHNRKTVDPTDPFANILGSTALLGACDAAMVIYKDKRSDKESSISITGRTVQSQDYKAVFDLDSFQWRLLGNLEDYEEEMEEQRYRNDPVVITIKALVEKSDTHKWSGRLKALIEASRGCGKMICESSQSIGRRMGRIKKQLQEFDGINTKEIRNGSGSKQYEFTSTA